MKVVLSSFKRELGGMRCVITVGTTIKISFENFQRQLLFREIYVKYLKKSSIQFKDYSLYSMQVLLYSFLQYQVAMKSKASNKHLICMSDIASSCFCCSSKAWSMLHHGSLGASLEQNNGNLTLNPQFSIAFYCFS